MLILADKLENFIGNGSINIKPAKPEHVLRALHSGFLSLVEDDTTADVLGNLLQVKVPVKTVDIQPKIGEDTVILATIVGPRLPEGTLNLPNTHSVQFSIIESNASTVNVSEAMDTAKTFLNEKKRAIGAWLLK